MFRGVRTSAPGDVAHAATGSDDFIPIRHKKYNIVDSCHCEGVKPEAISHR